MKTTNPTQNTDVWFDQLSDDEKIGQLIFVGAYSDEQENQAQIMEYIQKYYIGGLTFFQGEPIRQAQLINEYQHLTKIPLFVAMDAEWGLAMRLQHTPKYPYQMSLGACDADDLLYEMGKQIALQCKRLGVHINFAPVVDLNNNPKNPVISFRSFGEDKIKATHQAKIYRDALQAHGVMACLKHFPGHGDTDADSHLELPILMHTMNRLKTVELYPFAQLLPTTDSVMTAHLHIPALEKDPKPASLSYAVCTELLQQELGFQGLIFTDALDMKAVHGHYEAGQADVQALKAGNDILLNCADVPCAVRAIKHALRTGEISWQEINKKVRKILTFKQKYGLFGSQKIPISNILGDLNPQDALSVNQKLADKFVTVLSNQNQLIPCQTLKKNMVLVSIKNTAEKTTFAEQFNEINHQINFLYQTDIEEVRQKISTLKAQKSTVILAIHDLCIKPINQFGLTENLYQMIHAFNSLSEVIVILFGSPYILQKLPNLLKMNGLILAYEDTVFTQTTAARILRGDLKSVGKLPISLDFVKPATTRT